MRYKNGSPRTAPAKQPASKKQARKNRRGAPSPSPPTTIAPPTRQGSSRPRQNRATFLHLPPELRNTIYELILPSDTTIDITYGWPSLLFTHPQIASEARPLFFSTNTLAATSRGALTGLLDALGEVPAEHVRLIRAVELRFEGTVLAWERANGHYVPDFDIVDALVRQIAEVGLAAHQLTWTGVDAQVLADVAGKKLKDVLMPLHLLNMRVLTPLLKHHGLFDACQAPVDIAKHLKKEHESLGVNRDEAYRLARELHREDSRVEGWFEEWMADSELEAEDAREKAKAQWMGCGRNRGKRCAYGGRGFFALEGYDEE